MRVSLDPYSCCRRLGYLWWSFVYLRCNWLGMAQVSALIYLAGRRYIPGKRQVQRALRGAARGLRAGAGVADCVRGGGPGGRGRVQVPAAAWDTARTFPDASAVAAGSGSGLLAASGSPLRRGRGGERAGRHPPRCRTAAGCPSAAVLPVPGASAGGAGSGRPGGGLPCVGDAGPAALDAQGGAGRLVRDQGLAGGGHADPGVLGDHRDGHPAGFGRQRGQDGRCGAVARRRGTGAGAGACRGVGDAVGRAGGGVRAMVVTPFPILRSDPGLFACRNFLDDNRSGPGVKSSGSATKQSPLFRPLACQLLSSQDHQSTAAAISARFRRTPLSALPRT